MHSVVGDNLKRDLQKQSARKVIPVVGHLSLQAENMQSYSNSGAQRDKLYYYYYYLRISRIERRDMAASGKKKKKKNQDDDLPCLSGWVQ